MLLLSAILGAVLYALLQKTRKKQNIKDDVLKNDLSNYVSTFSGSSCPKPSDYKIKNELDKIFYENYKLLLEMKDYDREVIKNLIFSAENIETNRSFEDQMSLYSYFQECQEVIFSWSLNRPCLMDLCLEICEKNYELLYNLSYFTSIKCSSPSMSRLCDLLEAKNDYDRVVEICKFCDDNHITEGGTINAFAQRKERALKKCASSKNKLLIAIPQNIRDLLYIQNEYISENHSEPSTIYLDLSLHHECEKCYVPYFPDYSKLDENERWYYIDSLKHILDGTQDMGYVFLYYYGLERQMLEGDFDAAFDMIVSLRDVYDNKSFQKYSADALILTCLKKQKYEHLSSFLNSIDKPHELELDVDSYLFAKAVCGIGFDTMDIFKFRKAFAYTSTTYIKENKEQFLEYLEQSIVELVGDSAIDTSCLLEHAEDCGYTVVCPYANMSLHHVHAQVPCLHEQSPFYEYCGKALMLAHERVKEYRKEMRKALSASNNAKY